MTYLHLRSIAGSFLNKSRVVPFPVFDSNEVQEEEDFMGMMKYFFGDNSTTFEGLKYGSLFDSDIIMNWTKTKQLIEWLPNAKRSSKPELLYRASRDGWTAKGFHDKCDGKGATIVVVKSSDGYVFGVYTDVSWTSHSSGSFKSSLVSFLFSLKCHADLGPVKMGIKSEEGRDAVYHNRSSGATFGRAALRIGPNANQCKNSYGGIKNTYHLPTGSIGDKSSLTGNANGYFTVAEWEVFHI